MFSSNQDRPTERLKVDTEPLNILVISEPYIIKTNRGYALAIAVRAKKWKRDYELIISGLKSLAEGLEPLLEETDNKFLGLEFWIRKESSERTSRYLIEE